MRKASSIHSSRASHAGSFASQASNNAQSQAKLLEKKKEFDALCALERASAEYVRRMEAISVDCDMMADAGKVHGEVLSQWPEMFRILSLAVPSQSAQSGQTEDDQQNPSQQTCERLVRVPVEELQQQQESAK